MKIRKHLNILNYTRRSFSKTTNFVYFDYNELNDKTINLNDKIERAYGLNSLGVAIIKNIPNFEKTRNDYFSSFIDFYKLPDEIKNKYKCQIRDPIGWVDSSKTGVYKNENGNEEVIHQYYISRYPNETVRYPKDPNLEKESRNVWPLETPNYKISFNNYLKCLSGSINNMLYHLENYLDEKILNYNKRIYKKLENDYVISSQTILYLPNKPKTKMWNGWHTDETMITGLSYPQYFDQKLNLIDLTISGLYIKDRQGIEHRLEFNKNEFLIFPSALYFYLSAGHVLPLEHAVYLPENYPSDIYRANKSCFYEPQYDMILNIPTGESECEIKKRDPRNMEYSKAKFKEGIDFRNYMLNNFYDEVIN